MPSWRFREMGREESKDNMLMMHMFKKLCCSFCRRSEVAKLAAGPRIFIRRIYICDECARKAIHIMQGERTQGR